MISIVIPFYNEEKNISLLHGRLVKTLINIGQDFEIIFVDDGSTDNTFAEMKKLHPITALKLNKNKGQTEALGAGIRASSGDLIITMDGDLENQPEDIPLLIEKMKEGFDVVSGWRKDRWKDNFVTRKIPSLIANKLINFISGTTLHDNGCQLRVFKKEVLSDIMFIGEIHRMLATHVSVQGAKVGEVEVSYKNRIHGESKYGLSRTFRVVLDVISMGFFQRYSKRPMHFFGYVGFISIALGALAAFWALYLKIYQHLDFDATPLPVVVAFFVLAGFQFILMGLLAEIVIRVNKVSSKDNVELYKSE